MKLRHLGIVAIVGAIACTPQQAKTVQNAVFTVEDIACIVLNSGLIPDSNAVDELVSVCNIAPAVKPAIVQFINSLIGNPAALAKLKEAGLGAKK